MRTWLKKQEICNSRAMQYDNSTIDYVQNNDSDQTDCQIPRLPGLIDHGSASTG